MSFSEKLLARKYPVWFIPVIFFIGLIIVNWQQIISINDGQFVYTLDDAYIHLALAENIAQGHYGVNLHEYSAPSSSIIWPFLLAPFAQSSFGEFVPFIIAFIFSFGIIIVFCNTLYSMSAWFFKSQVPPLYTAYIILAGCILPVMVNLIGMTYIGMEHTLQTLASLLIIAAFFKEMERGSFPWWGIAAIIAAPFIRYEAGALSLGAIIALYYRGYFKKAVLCFVIIAVGILSFSYFLHSLGLELLPTSVLAKSHIRKTLPLPIAILVSIAANLYKRFGIYLSLGLIALFYKKSSWRQYPHISYIIAGGILAHIVFGDIRDRRYAEYLAVPLLLMLLISYSRFIKDYITNAEFFLKNPFLKLQGIALILIIIFYIGDPRIDSASVVPYASNNIYEQQFQMKRLVKIYNKPVGINDLGLVSYRNNNYVLDLWGLASLKALRLRQKEKTPEWMDSLCKERNVKLVMIYKTWFPEIPSHWIKLAQMNISRKNVTLGGDTVSFYATDVQEIPDIFKSLQTFKKILPSRIPFTFAIKEEDIYNTGSFKKTSF